MTSNLLDNRYRILQALGEGGFGATFLAEDTQMPSKRRCVIKQLKPVTTSPEVYKLVQERFQREAAILEDLGDGSGQIPRLYAYFSQDDLFYLVQEWVEGQTLTKKMVAEGPMSESAVQAILISLLPVLAYVHGKGIVHRDIKPDNIILRQKDNQPVLIDFGAVRETMGAAVNSQGETTSSIVIGTPGFMPSEQAAGRPVFSSDLYSIGLTAIFLLAGKWPQELQTDPQTGEIIWRQYAPHLSPAFAAVLDKSIQYHPRDRFPTAQAMLAALQSNGAAPPATAPLIHQAFANAAVPATVVNAPSGGVQPAYSPSQLPATIPDELAGWNWGAFLVPQFWAASNQVWLGLLSWIPIINYPVSFWLATKGNELAWKSRRWRDVEHFKSAQRAWAIGGAIAGITVNLWLWLILSLAVIGSFLPPAPETQSAKNRTENKEQNTNAPEKEAAPTEAQLEIEDRYLAKSNNGNLQKVKEPIFKQGDNIALVLVNVGKFKKGETGKHHFDMEIEIKNERGKVIARKKDLLGEEGETLLPKDIAKNPYGFIDTNVFNLEAGKYQFTLTIYDKISEKKASATEEFTIE